MLLAARCPVCGRPEGAPCPECAELFVLLGAVAPPPALDALHAAFTYAEATRPLVTGLKYRNQRTTTSFIASAMVSVLPTDIGPAVVTWAPTSPRRRRARGFDQAELLARAVGRRLRVPAHRLLVRRSSTAQTGRGGAERRGDPARFGPVRRAPPPVVLLVDDVVTTGATLSSAATVLRARGVQRVIGLVAAATPPPGGGSVRTDDR
jgi:ComF family protein